MTGPGPDDVLYAFGSFVADPVMGLLRRQGGQPVTLMSKSFEVLIALIQHRGELVEKDLLLKLVWPDTIVEENNLARHISALRKALGHEPNDHRYIVTVQGRGYRFVSPVQELTRGTAVSELIAPVAAPDNPTPPTASGSPFARLLRHRVAALVALGATAGVITSIAMFADFRSSQPDTSERKLWQLTSSGGLESEATWAPNGQAIAYSSDRAGNFDIWTQPVGEGNPIQLTTSPAQDWQPSWSSDGHSLVFRSERDGGGLFVVPATGGSEKRITTFGYRPQWSPSGAEILFASSNVGKSKLYLVNDDGQQLRRVLADLLGDFSSFRAAWHPDGRRISIYGVHRTEGLSFWTAPLDGRAPVRSDFAPDVRKRLKTTQVSLTEFRWAPAGNALYFEGRSDEAVNIWRVMVDPQTLQWREGPDRLTVGAGLDTSIALAPDGQKLAFTIRNERTRLWSFPFDANQGRVLGKGEPITASGADALYPNVAANGSLMVYRTMRRGKQELWKRPLLGGEDQLLTTGAQLSVPCWSADGSLLAFRRLQPTDRDPTLTEGGIVLLSSDGHHERLLTTPGPGPAAATPYAWSADGLSALARTDRQSFRASACCRCLPRRVRRDRRG